MVGDCLDDYSILSTQLDSVKETWLRKVLAFKYLHAKLVQPKLSLLLHHVIYTHRGLFAGLQ